MDWDKAFEEQAAKTGEVNDAAEPGAAQKSTEEFQRGLELGWWDEDGNSLLPDDDEEE